MENYPGLSKPLIEIESRYNPKPEGLAETEEKLRQALSRNLGEPVTDLKRLGIGQNVNFKVYIDNKEKPNYLLRVITMKGYPSMDTLEECYRLLDKRDLVYSHKKYFEKEGNIVPYGYLVQEWIEGDDALEIYGEENVEKNTKWLRDFVKVLKSVHTVKLPYFGYLGSGPRYGSLKEYYNNMDVIIDNSFGNVFKKPYTIWDLDRYGITSQGFLKRTFNLVKELADNIKSPSQSVLIHGDVLPQNLIYIKDGMTAIDWDEARANWWVYELARTSFYMDSKDIINEFIDSYGDTTVSIEDVRTGIKLEHIRQLLRYLFIACFNNADMDSMRKKVKEIENAIEQKFNQSI